MAYIHLIVDLRRFKEIFETRQATVFEAVMKFSAIALLLLLYSVRSVR